MEARLEKPEVWAWKKPDHKLTYEEFEAILEHWDYDPDNEEYVELDANGLEPIHDKFGNPTYGTFEAMYEARHGLTTPTTLEDLLAWIDSL